MDWPRTARERPLGVTDLLFIFSFLWAWNKGILSKGLLFCCWMLYRA
jgi:hypothetical protein